MIVMLHARRLHTNLELDLARHSRAPALRALPKDPVYPLHTGQYPVFVCFGLVWLRGPYPALCFPRLAQHGRRCRVSE